MLEFRVPVSGCRVRVRDLGCEAAHILALSLGTK